MKGFQGIHFMPFPNALDAHAVAPLHQGQARDWGIDSLTVTRGQLWGRWKRALASAPGSARGSTHAPLSTRARTSAWQALWAGGRFSFTSAAMGLVQAGIS